MAYIYIYVFVLSFFVCGPIFTPCIELEYVTAHPRNKQENTKLKFLISNTQQRAPGFGFQSLAPALARKMSCL